jgi:hypothetical protein
MTFKKEVRPGPKTSSKKEKEKIEQGNTSERNGTLCLAR